MKLVFVSNYLNHHTYPLCEVFLSRVEEFCFVSTMDTAGIGFTAAIERDYDLHYWRDAEKPIIRQRIMDADCVIFGDCPNELIEARMEQDRLSFIYSERLLKKGVWRRFLPHIRRAIDDRFTKHKDKRLYVLCASSFLPDDLRCFGFPTEKCYKWGYFPRRDFLSDEAFFAYKRMNRPVRIFWAARMIPLKHPEVVIDLAERLKKNGTAFQIRMAGAGPLEDRIHCAIIKKQLSPFVTLLGGISPEQTQDEMREADIFLFTSDKQEGWGAVVNEAMNAGCAVVCSDAVGSAAFLIRNGVNGCIYPHGDFCALYEKIEMLMASKDSRMQLGLQAKKTIDEAWNADEAARRFLLLVGELQKERVSYPFTDGPCSAVDR